MAPRSRRTEYMPLADIVPADVNPKGHDDKGIDASLERFGYVESIVLCERKGQLVAGNGRFKRLRAAKEAGEQPPDGVVVSKGEWAVPVQRGWASKDDSEFNAYLIASNELTTRGGWSDQSGLADMLTQLQAGPGLDGVGFTKDDLDSLLASLTPAQRDTGTLLALADVTIGEPQHVVEKGDVWTIDHRHALACLDVMVDHAQWVKLLTRGALFVPYPGPYAALSKRADETRFVMVQPDPFLAGHILDKFVAVYPNASLTKQ